MLCCLDKQCSLSGGLHAVSYTHLDVYKRQGSSSSDAGSAQSAEKADDTNLPYEYELDEDGNATLTKYTGSETEVVTPKTIDGHPVTRLEGTFRQPEAEKKDEAGKADGASSSLSLIHI